MYRVERFQAPGGGPYHEQGRPTTSASNDGVKLADRQNQGIAADLRRSRPLLQHDIVPFSASNRLHRIAHPAGMVDHGEIRQSDRLDIDGYIGHASKSRYS